ncbi:MULTISPECIES: hypothetical protein [unclassified Sphingomonas]|uniref:hypothetical protein n=1 Tax=unclassified Sphingomonas TaxID=196159 RepID=UPI00285DBAD8|nr:MULTISPECIES: hypothetical protein [unclassified Sphingomonas]MDR6113898.1 hypothetical protein [Sphingomonas sp. SORGH_AS_0789]MDR6148742.1 hypothetical protein [Sphingomonas sp. SORGH_AS_0742]
MAGTGEGARWTQARRRQFLAALAVSADAGVAARAVGETLGAVRGLRRRDPTFAEGWAEAIGAAHALVEEGLLRRMLTLLAQGGEEGGEAGAGTTGLSITPPLSATEVQLYLKLLARRDALAQAGDGANAAVRADAAETDAALERALDGLARRRLKGMA